MSTVSFDRSPFQIECHRADLDLVVMAKLADATLIDLARLLGIDASGVRPVRVIVADGASSVIDREIRVAPRPAGPKYTTHDWFELLFAHELTHLLVRDAWGMPAVLWWEGMAVHLGDDRVRTRLFGQPYHEWCRALEELEALLPLEPLLRASTYYRRRADLRTDLQAGSFCGFLLQTRGSHRLGRFLAESRPITAPGTQIVDPVLRRTLGDDLAGLQSEWVRFLRADVRCVPTLVEQLRERQLGGEPDRPDHCDQCFAVPGGTHGCLACAREPSSP